VVELTGVTMDYHSGWGSSGQTARVVRAVDDVTLTAPAGSAIGLVGGTGSGKSTLAQIIFGMIKPTGGTVKVIGDETATLRGRALREHQRKVQIVPQDPYSSLDPRRRAADLVAEPLTLGLKRPTAGQRQRVSEVLDLVGIPESKRQQYPHQFSGGQRQRLAIARALAPRPELIVLDEPTSALDVSIRAQILNLLKELRQELAVTYFVISHDIASVAYLADWVAVMHLGRIVETATVKSIYEAPAHPYTQLLLSSVPTAAGSFLDGASGQRPQIAAAAVRPDQAACKYAPQCALRASLPETSRCLTERPVLRPVADGHLAACHFTADGAEDLS
jgi:oligopeptide/dipeptide ABC transporter ATP-binding protein